ncbi:MAG: DUF4271 domain-containing protein [Paramuribaculum sp.]|nr:DUF4271 domain-containing protein [Paramuribaculum sp.]
MRQVDQISYLNEDPDIIVITTDSGEPITSATAADNAVSDSIGEIAEPTATLLDFSMIEGKVCTYFEMPSEPGVFGYRREYSAGIPVEPRPVLPGYDTGVASMVIGVFLLVALNLRHYSTFLKGFARDLFSVKVQDNLFEDHTVTETKVVLSLVLLLCLSAGVIINGVVSLPLFSGYSPAVPIAAFGICAGLYYLLQIVAYDVVGYTFTSNELKKQWVRGFNASQVLMGLVLWIPALIMLFDPAQCQRMFIVGLCLYIIARIIFIIKGFRIFYNNIFSLIYFILYLCSLEIIPLLIAYNIINYLTLS